MGKHVVAAIDIGGTFIKGALVDLSADGAIIWSESTPSHAAEGWEKVVEATVSFSRQVLAAAAAHGGRADLLAASVLGIFDEERGVAVTAANIDWRDLPLQDLLSERLGVPVVASHDSIAGLAEAVFGVGRGARTVMTTAFGTGIAGSLVYNGVPYRGAHFMALEIGHLAVPGFTERCGCGGIGHLEAVASAGSIGRRYRIAAGEPAESGSDSRRVLELATAGDELASRIWEGAMDAIGFSFMQCVTLLDPDVIVLAGGLAKAGEPLRSAIESRLQSARSFQRLPEVLISTLGDQAGVVGAAIAAARKAG
ncbi:MAG: ROK family protein [Propionibacteriaceae bacterium]|nr:ROK family protein [Propionibacteriaceae bacterium]